jgi:hypothetical protein
VTSSVVVSVTGAVLRKLAVIRSAMVRRVAERWPGLLGLMLSAGTMGPREEPGAESRSAPVAAARISRSRIRPVRPEPVTRVQSTPNSLAVRAARGLISGPDKESRLGFGACAELDEGAGGERGGVGLAGVGEASLSLLAAGAGGLGIMMEPVSQGARSPMANK